MGIKGHVCSFIQDINEVATTLPRLPADVKAVKMVRTYKGSDGTEKNKTHFVNKERVIKARRAVCVKLQQRAMMERGDGRA